MGFGLYFMSSATEFGSVYGQAAERMPLRAFDVPCGVLIQDLMEMQILPRPEPTWGNPEDRRGLVDKHEIQRSLTLRPQHGLIMAY